MSPHVTLALLLPVQCDPFFAHEYYTLRVLYRYATNAQLQRLQHVAQMPAPPAQDGPARVIHSILNGPLAEPATRLLQGNVNDKEQWQHDMREAWRQRLLLRETQRTHYAGVDNADRHRTLSYLEMLQQRAQRIEVTDIPAQLAILRRALAGGLLTEDRITQHKQKSHAQDVPCECGHRTATVLHCTWTCPKYSHLRQTFCSFALMRLIVYLCAPSIQGLLSKPHPSLWILLLLYTKCLLIFGNAEFALGMELMNHSAQRLTLILTNLPNWLQPMQ